MSKEENEKILERILRNPYFKDEDIIEWMNLPHDQMIAVLLINGYTEDCLNSMFRKFIKRKRNEI